MVLKIWKIRQVMAKGITSAWMGLGTWLRTSRMGSRMARVVRSVVCVAVRAGRQLGSGTFTGGFKRYSEHSQLYVVIMGMSWFGYPGTLSRQFHGGTTGPRKLHQMVVIRICALQMATDTMPKTIHPQKQNLFHVHVCPYARDRSPTAAKLCNNHQNAQDTGDHGIGIKIRLFIS